MKKDKLYYQSLLQGFFDNKLQPDQVNELLDWIDEKPEEYKEAIELPENQMTLMKRAFSADIPAEVTRQMRERLMNALNTDTSVGGPVRKSLPVALRWLPYAAAIIVVLGTGIYMLTITDKKQAVAELAKPQNNEPIDVAPGNNKAILTFADGTTVNLDSITKGTIGQQGNSTIIKTGDGRLVYHVPSTGKLIDKGSNTAGFNTMSTPRGGQYQLTLPDGTDVWLNAESSITYPTSFAEQERRVSITGEVYFEVAKDNHRPFRVFANKGFEIEVLGTHFNVNCYPDEPTSKTTLLEGRIKISSLASSGQRSPSRTVNAGQQAVITSENIRLSNSADLESVMAWKEGIFSLNSADITAVMRQLSRWYNIEVVYEGTPPSGRISGTVPRNMYLSKVVEAFQISGINIKIEGKKVVVRQ
ncbi:MAG: FecR domain-containing protein [Chitinophagaceae bacterium]|nr:FecR domain-containing protein [Chitinophagaceae bacterium]